MPKPWRIAAVLTCLLLPLALAACSGSVNIGSSPSPSGPVTYTDPEYGYSITHDAQFTKGESSDSVPAAGSSAVSGVIFADEDGTLASDTYLDAIKVSVYKLARSVKPDEVPGLKAELQGTVDDMLASMQNAEVIEPLTEVEVNGVPGFSVKYSFEDLGEQLTIASVFLFDGDREYQIATQSASGRWAELQSAFDEAVQSFTVK